MSGVRQTNEIRPASPSSGLERVVLGSTQSEDGVDFKNSLNLLILNFYCPHFHLTNPLPLPPILARVSFLKVLPGARRRVPTGLAFCLQKELIWTLRILSGISEGICNTMVQSGGEFLYIGVGGR